MWWRATASAWVLAGISACSDVDRPAYLPDPDGSIAPTEPVCGNGTREDGEYCDDGDTLDGDGCSADCQTFNPVCDTDGYPPSMGAGYVRMPPAVDVAPLCDGWVLVGDIQGKAIVLTDAMREGEVLETWPIPGVPYDLEYDGDAGLLYATQIGVAEIAVLDVAAGTVSSIALPRAGAFLALGPPGRLFVRLGDADIRGDVTGTAGLAIVDTTKATVLNTIDADVPPVIVYSARTQRLFAAPFVTEGALERWRYDASTELLELEQSERLTSTGSPWDVAVSADGTRLSLAGNGRGGIEEYDATDLRMQLGQWDTDSRNARSVAYDTGGKFVIGGQADQLNAYDIDAYEILSKNSFGNLVPGCDPWNTRRMRQSRGRQILFAGVLCGGDEFTRMYRVVLDPALL